MILIKFLARLFFWWDQFVMKVDREYKEIVEAGKHGCSGIA